MMLHNIPVLSYLFSYLNLVLFGLQVTPKCEIGPGIFFPHTVGTVVGAWKLGKNVTIFQNVTLGSKSLDMTFTREILPSVGDSVTIGSGAKVLGGIHIGDNVVIGANSVVIRSVEDGLTVAGIPAQALETKRVTL